MLTIDLADLKTINKLPVNEGHNLLPLRSVILRYDGVNTLDVYAMYAPDLVALARIPTTGTTTPFDLLVEYGVLKRIVSTYSDPKVTLTNAANHIELTCGDFTNRITLTNLPQFPIPVLADYTDTTKHTVDFTSFDPYYMTDVSPFDKVWLVGNKLITSNRAGVYIKSCLGGQYDDCTIAPIFFKCSRDVGYLYVTSEALLFENIDQNYYVFFKPTHIDIPDVSVFTNGQPTTVLEINRASLLAATNNIVAYGEGALLLKYGTTGMTLATLSGMEANVGVPVLEIKTANKQVNLKLESAMFKHTIQTLKATTIELAIFEGDYLTMTANDTVVYIKGMLL